MNLRVPGEAVYFCGCCGQGACPCVSLSQNQLQFPLKYDLLCKNTNDPGAVSRSVGFCSQMNLNY